MKINNYVLGLCALFFCSFFVNQSQGQEMLLNGGLENWTSSSPDDWTKAESLTQDANDPHGGASSGLRNGGSGTKDLAQTINGITPGNDYTISFWYKVSGGDGTDARIWSYWKNGSTNLSDNAAELRGPNGNYLPNSTAWQQYTVTLTAPATADNFYFEVRSYSGSVVNWDDLSFVEIVNSCPLSITVDSVVCDARTSGTDSYTTYVSYTGGGQGAGTYTINQTITGDDPNTVAAGQFTIAGTEGTDITLTITSTDCMIEETITSPGCVVIPNIVINEFLADPDATNGDANGDGVVNTSQDEFVELFNNDNVPVDLSGWTISDATSVRFTFPNGVTISVGGYVTAFGGGTPTNIPGDTAIAGVGFMSLNNGGDDIVVKDSFGNVVAMLTYGGEGGNNVALGRDPDTTGAFVAHNLIIPTGRLFSPGQENSFTPTCPLTVTLDSVVCDANTTGTDAYTAYYSYTGGGQGAGTYTANQTLVGDDINTVASGSFTIAGTEGTDINLTITSADCNISIDATSPACVPCAPAGDIIITEFMANPVGISDNLGEYVELYNRSNVSYDLNGYTLTDQGSNAHTISSSVIIAPDSFVVLAISDTLGALVDYVYSNFSLSNGSDEIILRCPNNSLVTSVTYTNGDPFGSGVATELKCLDLPGASFDINDFVAGTDAFSYTGSDTNFGSPGALGNTVGAVGPAALLLSDDVPAISGSGVTVTFTVCATDADTMSSCGYNEVITLTQTAGPAAAITMAMVTATEGCAEFEVTMPTVTLCDSVKFLATANMISSDTFNILVKELIHVEDFTCATQTWSVQNVDGQSTWTCDTMGGYVSCNVFGDTTTVSEDWIISPALDLSLFKDVSMHFRSRERFNGPALELYYSEDYSGTGDPNAATWMPLSFAFDNSQNGFSFAPWTASGDVSLPSNSSATYVGFKYTATITSTETMAAEWLIDDMVISGCPNLSGGLVINEAYNDQSFSGPTCTSHGAFIELLVVPSLDDTTTTAMNLQNWIIEPSTGEPGHARIKSGCLTNVPVGALVVIYNADKQPAGIPGPDETDSNNDMIYYIPSNSACLEYTSDATYPGTTYTSGDDGTCTHANQISAFASALPLSLETRRSTDATVFDALQLTSTGSSSMDCNNITDDSAVIHGTTETPGAANTDDNGLILEAVKNEAGNGMSGSADPDAINYVNYLTDGLTKMCGEIVTISCVDTLVLTGPMSVSDTSSAAMLIQTTGAITISGNTVFDAPQIILGPNFEVPLGFQFTTVLDGCGAMGGRSANIQVIRVIDEEDEHIIDLRAIEE